MDQSGNDLRPLPFALGMIIGALTGFALWLATDTFVFLPAFIGVGVALGLVFSSVTRNR